MDDRLLSFVASLWWIRWCFRKLLMVPYCFWHNSQVTVPFHFPWVFKRWYFILAMVSKSIWQSLQKVFQDFSPVSLFTTSFGFIGFISKNHVSLPLNLFLTQISDSKSKCKKSKMFLFLFLLITEGLSWDHRDLLNKLTFLRQTYEK